MRCVKTASIHSLAVIAYCCLFSFMSLLTRFTLIAGILYTAIVEGLLANLPFGIRLVTVIYYTRLIAYRNLDFTDPAANAQSSQPQPDVAAEYWKYDVADDPQLLLHPNVQTCILTLAIASFAMSVIAAFICARSEFYVKTPETA